MRLPREAELSPEQREACYIEAKGTALVIGPPGCGKTVIARFRLDRLREDEQEAVLLMFNRVLARYTGESKTFLTWMNAWWRSMTSGRCSPRAT